MTASTIAQMRVLVALAMLGGLAHADTTFSRATVAPTPAPPPPAPAAAPAPVAGIPTIDTRWAFGLALGLLSVEPSASGSNSQGLGFLELAGRFRPVYYTEVQLALDLGGKDDIQYSALFVDVRFRFNPDDTWRWSLTGGLGVATVADKHGTDDDKKGRGALRFGGGVERRFGRFAAIAEIKLHLIAKNDKATVVDPKTQAYYLASSGMSGYGFQVGGSYSW